MHLKGPLGSGDKNSISSKVVRVILHPEWQNKNYSAGSDLALIEVSDTGGKSLVQIGTRPIVETEKTIVGGFGCKGPGIPRYSHMTIAIKYPIQVQNGGLIFGILDADGVGLSMACSGDSGAGVYRASLFTKKFEVIAVNHSINLNPSKLHEIFVMDLGTKKIKSYTGKPELTTALLSDPITLVWLKSVLPASVFFE